MGPAVTLLCGSQKGDLIMNDLFTGAPRSPLPETESDCVLSVLGTLQVERRLVSWGPHLAALTPKCFKFLSKLAVAAVAEPGRWVRRDELERGENQARYLYRLKGELETQCGRVPELWENNRRGSYRLKLHPDRIQIHWERLLDNDDWDLVTWVKSFERGTAEPCRLSLEAESGQPVAA